MKREDLGYSPSGAHNPVLTNAESVFAGLLWLDHVGADCAVPADELAVRFGDALMGRETDEETLAARIGEMETSDPALLDRMKRDVRRMQCHLLDRHDNLIILSKAGPSGGYFIAAGDSEIEDFYASFRRRGLHGLRKAARGNRGRLAGIVTQAVFDFDGLGELPLTAGDSAAFETVDALLSRMTAQPERYAKVLSALGAKHGRRMMSTAALDELRRKAADVARMAEEVLG